MKSHRKILYFGFAAAFGATAAIYISYLFSAVSHTFLMSVFTAFGIITFNFILTIISIKLGERGAGNSFINFYLGGMLFRFFLMLAMVLISLKFLDISRNSFIFSILIFYVFYLIIEIIYLNFRKH